MINSQLFHRYGFYLTRKSNVVFHFPDTMCIYLILDNKNHGIKKNEFLFILKCLCIIFLRIFKNKKCVRNINSTTWTSIWNIHSKEGIHCTKFGHFQAKGLKDIERTTFVQKNIIWTWSLTLWQAHISQCAFTVPTLGTLYRPTNRCKRKGGT